MKPEGSPREQQDGAAIRRVLFVTDRHGVRIGRGEDAWVPYGTRHARRLDSRTTVCGLSTLGWEIFWHLEFDFRHRQACTDCAAHLYPQLHPRHGRGAGTEPVTSSLAGRS